MTEKLFVYGTLRSDVCPLPPGWQSLGEAWLHGFDLFDINGLYPAIVPGEGTVKGEFISIPAYELPEVDGYEGVEEGLYERQPVVIESKELGAARVWAYVWAQQHGLSRRVEGGDWMEVRGGRQ